MVGGNRQAGLTDGERWAQELLDELRGEHFHPGAFAQLIVASLRRARVVRGRRPQLVRQSRHWGAFGLVAALPLGARVSLSWLGWWAMIDWHLGMLETADGRPRPLGAADAMTLARLWLSPVVRRHPALPLACAGIATDLLDGALARRAGPTRLGRDLDSTADTLFLHALLAGAAERHGLDPAVGSLERARLIQATAITFRSYFGSSVAPPRQQNRGLAAVLAAAGALAAVSGRRASAELLLSAAIGYRSVIRLRAR
ncbi:MAG: hypothetical protein NVSMB25_24210 [Thermoleophilaceae bacterium]